MVEHKRAYSKDNNPNATFYVDEQIVVDLFPYKIKDRSLFYHRTHPIFNPQSISYEKYWLSFMQRCIEGYWIEDKNGTWVFMMPKLFYYINYVIILDENREKIQPDLCDLEWIFFTYFLCMDGFSGFEGDDTYTSHRLIERYEKSQDSRLPERERKKYELNEVEASKIPIECYSKETGKMKKFIDPWTYLTRTYLIDEPRGPLGKALYQNKRHNGFILGARGIRKSFTVFMGDFMHEFTFSGVRDWKDVDKVNNPLLFAMGSGATDQLQRTINNIRGFYDDQPGKYRYDDPDIPTHMGPFYKNYQGKFEVGNEFQHIIKGKGNTVELFGSTVQMAAITPDRTKIVAGDRFRRVYIEEVGFLEYILEVFSANIDSVQLQGKPVGSWIGLGTGGDMEAIRGSKQMFENPGAFNICSIPYFWKNPDKAIGLFIPGQYQKRELDDGNGFIYLDLATKEILKEREVWFSELDSVSAAARLMYNPIIPDEMLIPNELSVLPKKEMQLRLSEIESKDLFKRVANVGTLVYDASYNSGVRFDKDFDHKVHPILEYVTDFNKIDMSGGFVLYEPPPHIIPKYMYWVIYDPAAKSGEGTSLHSILVYKHFLAKDGKNLTDTIVAEWIGRLPTLEQNYEMVLKIARFFNAKIFPETNVAGFVEWCRTNNYYHMLQGDSYDLEKEISPGSKRSHYRAGFNMQARKKWWALQRYTDWLLEWKVFDEETGMPLYRNLDFIYSPRILNEGIYYNEVDNFDHTSSMLGLMLLLGQLDRYKPADEDDLDDSDFDDPIIYKEVKLTRRRSLLEKF